MAKRIAKRPDTVLVVICLVALGAGLVGLYVAGALLVNDRILAKFERDAAASIERVMGK